MLMLMPMPMPRCQCRDFQMALILYACLFTSSQDYRSSKHVLRVNNKNFFFQSLLIKRQSYHHIETIRLICTANQSTVFYLMATSAFNELKLKAHVKDLVLISLLLTLNFLQHINLVFLLLLNLNIKLFAALQKFTYSKSTIEILEKGVKFVQS